MRKNFSAALVAWPGVRAALEARGVRQRDCSVLVAERRSNAHPISPFNARDFQYRFLSNQEELPWKCRQVSKVETGRKEARAVWKRESRTLFLRLYVTDGGPTTGRASIRESRYTPLSDAKFAFASEAFLRCFTLFVRSVQTRLILQHVFRHDCLLFSPAGGFQ